MNFDEITQLLLGYVPNVIGAVVILIIGWIIAIIVAGLMRGLVGRMRLNERVGPALAETGTQRPPQVERWIGTLVFWLIMLVAIMGALQALNLTLLVAPFNELVGAFLNFVPRLIAAAIVAVVAWLVATVLRFLTVRGLRAVRFDERLADEQAAQATGGGEAASAAPQSSNTRQGNSPSQALGTTVYWLVWLLFLPALLGALGLQSLLLPVQQLLTELLLFLPNILAAAAIFIVGWFAAGFVRRIVTTVVRGLGADRLSDTVGLSNVLGKGGLSGLIGWLVYILILIPVAIGALNALGIPAITAPASAMLAVFLSAIPSIFAAAALIAVSFVVGRIVARLVAELLTRVGFNRWMEQLRVWNPPATPVTGEQGALEVRTPADIVGLIVLVGIILFASTSALNLLGLDLVAGLVAEFTVLAGRILLGLVVFAIGLVLASLAARAIVASRIAQAGLLALTARASILVLATAMALRQMGLANEIVNLAFGLLFGAFAVAFALAFGLGGREPAQKEVERFFQGLRNRQIGGNAPTMETPRIETGRRPSEGTQD